MEVGGSAIASDSPGEAVGEKPGYFGQDKASVHTVEGVFEIHLEKPLVRVAGNCFSDCMNCGLNSTTDAHSKLVGGKQILLESKGLGWNLKEYI